jgi:hypothetical protein
LRWLRARRHRRDAGETFGPVFRTPSKGHPWMSFFP